MKQVVPVSFDPFAEDPEETQGKDTESKAGKSSATKLTLEVTLSKEVMSSVSELLAAHQQLIALTEQNQRQLTALLETLTKPKKVKLIRDGEGRPTEAVSEYEKPRLN